MQAYYFGVWPGTHRRGLYAPCGTEGGWLPFHSSILDGGLLPPGVERHHGSRCVSTVNGWTVVTYIDLSTDDNLPALSAFVLEPGFGETADITICRAFPGVMERMREYALAGAFCRKLVDNGVDFSRIWFMESRVSIRIKPRGEEGGGA